MSEKREQKKFSDSQKSVTISETLEDESSIPKEDKPRSKSAEKSQKTKVSVCDVMKDNTSKVIKKLESQTPANIQLYSDLYAEYLHMFDDLFGTCYISEKQFFDKLGLDQNTLKTFDNYSNNLTNFYTTQIDLMSNFQRAYVQMRIAGIKSYDKYMHAMMDSYAMMLTQFNSIFKNKNFC